MTTNNHQAHGPVSLDRLHQIREHLQHDTQYSNGGNRAYILADMLKVIDRTIAAFGAEHVGEVSEQRDGLVMDGTVDLGGNSTHRIIKGASKMKRLPIGTKFYITPQSPEPMKDHQIRELVNELRDLAIEYHGTQQLRERIARTVRAAMLQGAEPVSNRDDLTDDFIRMLTGRAKYLREKGEIKSPYLLDRAAAALKGENADTTPIPNGWKLVPIDPTKDMLRAGQSVVGFWLNTVHCYSKMLAAAPAAPQQDVRLALEIGMSRYAGAMQKLVDSGD
ncbi:hypothetical protein [Citrobacter portucalensis]|uniref:hypothetical protein n=1 Tax=Citrobacter portucalensis TaxID=1639133 RepID=UPI0025511F6C|nr:hypothetical protein [Citrobacter portucalensis]